MMKQVISTHSECLHDGSRVAPGAIIDVPMDKTNRAFYTRMIDDGVLIDYVAPDESLTTEKREGEE